VRKENNMPKFEREVEIDAPVEKVWDVLTNQNTWPQWFPGIEEVSNITDVVENSQFTWKDEGRIGQGTIVKVDLLKRLEVITQMGDDRDSHVFTLKPSGGLLGLAKDETKLTYELDTLMGGGIISKFIAGGNPRDTLRVKKAVHALRRTVESM
jgi:uncharacterized protein YndB with AHSA1/START domain